MTRNDISVLTEKLVTELETSTKEISNLKDILESNAIEQRPAETCVFAYQRLQDNYLTIKSEFESTINNLTEKLVEAGILQVKEPEPQAPEPEVVKKINLEKQKQEEQVKKIEEKIEKENAGLQIKPGLIEEDDDQVDSDESLHYPEPIDLEKKKPTLLERLSAKHGGK